VGGRGKMTVARKFMKPTRKRKKREDDGKKTREKGHDS